MATNGKGEFNVGRDRSRTLAPAASEKRAVRRNAAIVLVLALGIVACGLWMMRSRGRTPAPSATPTTSAPVAETPTAPPPKPGMPPEFTAGDFVVISSAVSPRVAYALRRQSGFLYLALEADGFADNAADVDPMIGVSAAKFQILTAQRAAITRQGARARFQYAIPDGDLVAKPDDWSRLRMAVAVRWTGGLDDQDRQRERYRHLEQAAPHAGLSPNLNHWQFLDLQEYEAVVADRQNLITVPIVQPMDGKLTVVIEDAAGRRVRNLLSGVEQARGETRIEWDGLDDDGRLVTAGSYRWRSISHPGIEPQYLFSFGNGDEQFAIPFGSNHMHFTQAAANRKYVFLAAPMTEGGHAMCAFDHTGAWKHGYNPIHGSGMYAVAAAADEKILYVAHDGPGWGQDIDRSKPDWVGTVNITLSRFDIESSRPLDYPGERFVKIESHEWGPGARQEVLKRGMSLAGMALLNGKLYVASRAAEALLVVDPATAKISGKVALPAPGPLTVDRNRLLAVSGTSIVLVEPAGETRTLVPAGRLQPRGIAADGRGQFYISDGATHTVQVFDRQGQLQRRYGKPGGPYAGAYDPERMISPSGLAVAGGWLWVTEDRRNPKRALAWSLASGKVVAQKYGNPPYGGPGASFDTADHTRWLGLRCQWELDFDKQTATCKSVLQKSAGHLGGIIPWMVHYRFWHQNGRTFLLGMDKANIICELLPDGTVKDLALISEVHTFSYACNWNPPDGFVKAFKRRFPDAPDDLKFGKNRGTGVLWVDRNGDGLCQEEEFDFASNAKRIAGSGWGHNFYDLTVRVPLTDNDGKHGILVLKPEGFLSGGAPNYPKLNDAVSQSVRFKTEAGTYDYKGINVESTVDRFGNMVLNTDPKMVAYAPDGTLKWQYPNRWSNVHGSHDAPLPEVGVLQGVLFFLGVAPLDDQADVFIVNGNHGRFFAMTTDGLYLDEMFKDVRLGGSRDAYWVGGEAFGGSFAKSEKDGNYYLQTGGDGFRIFRVDGLDRCVRAAGEITITPEQLMAAERKLARRSAAAALAKEATIPRVAKPITVDGDDREWDKADTVSWDRNGMFKVRVKCAYDAQNLYLYYSVDDPSPWVNNGTDWTTLFKTGDSVDLQLATDPKAPAQRRGPAPGDLRLLIAPSEGKPLAVLYRHRMPGARNPVTFTCPWRREKVDEVKKLPNVKVAVKTGDSWYHLEAAIPLADLEFSRPAGVAKADFGVVYGDPDGTINVLRSYWANQATGLVNDVPGEIMLQPNLWGSIEFEGGKP